MKLFVQSLLLILIVLYAFFSSQKNSQNHQMITNSQQKIVYLWRRYAKLAKDYAQSEIYGDKSHITYTEADGKWE